MIPKATVGRIVHFNNTDGRIEAAMIVHVFSDECVNLAVWNSGGTQRLESSCLLGEGASKWSWPTRV